MDKIYAMKLFVRMAERESFSRAAEDVCLSKGSVSRQIQALENQLGTRLLHLTTRRVHLFMIWLTETIKRPQSSRVFSISWGRSYTDYSINDEGLPT